MSKSTIDSINSFLHFFLIPVSAGIGIILWVGSFFVLDNERLADFSKGEQVGLALFVGVLVSAVLVGQGHSVLAIYQAKSKLGRVFWSVVAIFIATTSYFILFPALLS